MITQRIGVAAMRRGAAQSGLTFNQHIPKLAMTANFVPAIQTRLVATAKVSNDQGHEILAKQRLNRPVAPHLTVYKLNQTWFGSSAWNRITGCTLAGTAYVYFAGYLVAPLLGWHWESASVAAAMGSLPFLVQGGIKTFLSFPFVFHFVQSLRHIAFDMGTGFNKAHIVKAENIVWASSVVGALALAFGL
jgi:succinate dehydrogenase (ubiquinone) cytochrome b560 subunit